MGRDERLAVFSIPAFWSRGLMMGFLPYVTAMPMVLWGLALAIRNVRAPTSRRTWELSAWSAAFFFVHLDGFVVFVATAVCMQAVGLEERGVLLRAEGLHSCPQVAWSVYRKTVAEIVSPPEGLILFCGMSIGFEDASVSYVRTGRASLSETVTFLDG